MKQIIGVMSIVMIVTSVLVSNGTISSTDPQTETNYNWCEYTIVEESASYVSESWSPDSKNIAISFVDEFLNISIFELSTFNRINIINRSLNCAICIDWNPNGDYLAVSLRNVLQIYETETWSLVKTMAEPSRYVKWNPDGSLLASGLENGSISVWETDTWILKKSLSGYDQALMHISWNPSSDQIATIPLVSSVGYSSSVKIWDIWNGTILANFPDLDQAFCVEWGPDSKEIAIGVLSGVIIFSNDFTNVTKNMKTASTIDWVKWLGDDIIAMDVGHSGFSGLDIVNIRNETILNTMTGRDLKISPDNEWVISHGTQRKQFLSLWGKDIDHDETCDIEDAFPTDPSASIDSDSDGFPDSWNEGMGPEDSTTGLTLDPDPDDPDNAASENGSDDDDYIFWILVTVLIIGIAASGIFFFRKRDDEIEDEQPPPLKIKRHQ